MYKHNTMTHKFGSKTILLQFCIEEVCHGKIMFVGLLVTSN
jgi:hypothetical protein